MVAARTARSEAATQNYLHTLATRSPVIGKVVRPVALGAAITVLKLRGRGHVPSRRVLRCLRFGWANQVYSGSLEYVEEVARQAIEARGSILEAGSGLTSIVLSYVARRDQIVISLEHLPQWAKRVSRSTSGHGMHRVLARPLTRYVGYDWYAVSAEDLPSRRRLSHRRRSPRRDSRRTLWRAAQLAARLGSDAVFLLDDADRSSEKHVVARWAQKFQARVEVRNDGSRAFAVIRVTGPDRWTPGR